MKMNDRFVAFLQDNSNILNFLDLIHMIILLSGNRDHFSK